MRRGKSKYFTKEYDKVLREIFKLGIKIVDISVHSNGIIITSPRRKNE